MIELGDWDGKQTDSVICGDALEVMAKSKQKFALAFSSPPYAVGKVVSAFSEAKVKKGHNPYDYYDYDEHDDDEYDEAKYEKWLEALCDVSEIVFWNVPSKQFDRRFGVSDRILRDRGIGQVIWNKPNSMPFPKRGVIYFHETIWVFGDKKRILKPFKSVWTATTTRWSKHPAPFPPELPAQAINSASRQGDVIFDPFGGSGTTAAVAKALGRRFVTSDISRQYCDWIDERIEKTKVI